MCTVNLAVAGLSTAMGGYSVMSQQKAQQQAHLENARMARENYIRQQIQEQRIRQNALFARGQVHSGAISFIGQQKASLAGAGAVIGRGTAAQAIQNTRIMAERQRQMQLRNENIAIADNQRQAQAYLNQANAYGRQAANIHPWRGAFIGGFQAGYDAYGKLQPSSQKNLRDDLSSLNKWLNPFSQWNQARREARRYEIDV